MFPLLSSFLGLPFSVLWPESEIVLTLLCHTHLMWLYLHPCQGGKRTERPKMWPGFNPSSWDHMIWLPIGEEGSLLSEFYVALISSLLWQVKPLSHSLSLKVSLSVLYLFRVWSALSLDQRICYRKKTVNSPLVHWCFKFSSSPVCQLIVYFSGLSGSCCMHSLQVLNSI